MSRRFLVALFSVVCAGFAAAAVAAPDQDFERVFPADYGEMLVRAKNAYAGKRYDDAFKLFQRTACAGDKESQSALGRMYLLGQGVAEDDLTGYAWLKVAAEFVFPGYQSIVHKLAQAMTPEQHAIADPAARRLIDLYGLAATDMSCRALASRGGHILDTIMCTPQRQGSQVRLRRCVTEAPE